MGTQAVDLNAVLLSIAAALEQDWSDREGRTPGSSLRAGQTPHRQHSRGTQDAEECTWSAGRIRQIFGWPALLYSEH
jgi:hypothetical protein